MLEHLGTNVRRLRRALGQRAVHQQEDGGSQEPEHLGEGTGAREVNELQRQRPIVAAAVVIGMEVLNMLEQIQALLNFMRGDDIACCRCNGPMWMKDSVPDPYNDGMLGHSYEDAQLCAEKFTRRYALPR